MALTLSDLFRMPTSVVYPPFKNGLYLEEAFYAFYQDNKEIFEKTSYIYIPAFWTNFQIHPQFHQFKHMLQMELDEVVKAFPPDQKYFTIVQHDDAVLLRLPPNTLIFGACSGHIPLPLIYEDRQKQLETRPKVSFEDKDYFVSFIGSETHQVRLDLFEYVKQNSVPWYIDPTGTPLQPGKNRNQLFLEVTQRSKFALAPRGYGRSSFRFFEVFLLGSIPVYIWDDVEWLPYKDKLNYSELCVSIHKDELPLLQSKLESISQEQYTSMLEGYSKMKHWFTLEGMSRYVLDYLQQNQSLDISKLPYSKGKGSL